MDFGEVDRTGAMDAWTCVVAVAGVATVLWVFAPYLRWWECSWRALEAHVARTSFQCGPGELVHPAWKTPEVELSVVVPAYNEEYRLPHMLDECLMYLEARAASSPGFTYEVIVIDDGSRDGTYEAAMRCGIRLRDRPRAGAAADHRDGKLRVLRLTANRGKGFAARIGVLAARGRFVLMADADGATRIADVELLERALGAGCTLGRDPLGVGVVPFGPSANAGIFAGGLAMPEIAFGSRHHLREETCARRYRVENVLNICFEYTLWALVGSPIYDTQCGFKLFHAPVGKRLFAALHLYRWSFDIELVLLANWFGKRIAEVPVTWIEMPGAQLRFGSGRFGILRDVVLAQCCYLFGVWRASSFV